MKILCVIDSLGSGGAQGQLVAIARGFKLRGHEVEFFVYYPSDHYQGVLDDDGIVVHRSIKRYRFSITPIFALRKLIQRRKYGVVLAFLSTPSIYAECACFGLRKVKLVVSERSVSPDGKIRWAQICKAILHLQSNLIIVNSKSHSSWIHKVFPWLRTRLVTITNGVDTDTFKPRDNIMVCGTDQKEESDVIKLVAVGRISKVKNILRLIEALKIVGQTQPTITLDWIGRDDDSMLLAESRSLLKKMGLEESWNWKGELRNIFLEMNKYDALILPSLWEGFPNVVCEALSSGLPVLGSNVSDIPFLVEEGTRGFLFNPLLPDDIASAIMKFIKLKEGDKARMGEAAREFALENLSYSKLIDQYENILAR